jgi:hypothetical protein
VVAVFLGGGDPVENKPDQEYYKDLLHSFERPCHLMEAVDFIWHAHEYCVVSVSELVQKKSNLHLLSI